MEQRNIFNMSGFSILLCDGDNSIGLGWRRLVGWVDFRLGCDTQPILGGLGKNIYGNPKFGLILVYQNII